MRGGEQLTFRDVDEALDAYAQEKLPKIHSTIENIEKRFGELGPDVTDADPMRTALSVEYAELEKQLFKLGKYCAARGLIDDRWGIAA